MNYVVHYLYYHCDVDYRNLLHRTRYKSYCKLVQKVTLLRQKKGILNQGPFSFIFRAIFISYYEQNKEENAMFEAILESMTREYEVCETVYNKEKKEVQVVLSLVPPEKREAFGMPKRERCYICGKLGEQTWTVESGKNLRPATIFEKKF